VTTHELDTNARAIRVYDATGWHADGGLKSAKLHGVPIRELRYQHDLVVWARGRWTVGFCEDLVGGLGPDEGVGAVVVPLDDESALLGVEAPRGAGRWQASRSSLRG